MQHIECFCEIWVETEKPVVHQANNVAQPDDNIQIDQINEDWRHECVS